MPNGNSYNPFILRPTSVRGNTILTECPEAPCSRWSVRYCVPLMLLETSLSGCPEAPCSRRSGRYFTDRGNSVACFTTRSSTALRGRRPRARGGASDTAYRLFSFPFEAKPHSDGVPEGTVLAAERAILRIARFHFRLGRNPTLTECPEAPTTYYDGCGPDRICLSAAPVRFHTQRVRLPAA